LEDWRIWTAVAKKSFTAPERTLRFYGPPRAGFFYWAHQMTQYVIANNVNTQLAAALPSSGSGSTTVTLASSANLPTLTAGQIMPLTLNDAATGQSYEIVYVTAISGVSLTVTRAQEGTGALNWNVGDYTFCAPTAGTVATALGNPNDPFAVAPATSANQAPQFQQVNPGRLLNIRTFTASGTYSISSSSVATIIVCVQAAGAGGNGAPATGAAQSSMGLGGSGGSYYSASMLTQGLPASIPVTIGAAGSAGAVGGAGGAGGATSFGSIISCPGGLAGGVVAAQGSLTPFNGALGPAAATVSLPAGSVTLENIPGQGANFSILGGGALAAGSGGGSSRMGTGGNNTQGVSAGQSAKGFGGGGGGASVNTASTAGQPGGAGAPGIIVIYEYS
jgi:hypothetical protein